MTARAVHLDNIRVLRGKRTILDVRSFILEQGAFYGLIGPNGAGKTTLLKLIAALIVPDVGAVEVLDHRITSLPRWKLPAVRRKIAYVPQSIQFNQSVPLIAREIVTMGIAGNCGLIRRPERKDRDLVATWIDRLDLGPLQDQTFHSLSGGERQKVLIAKAMVQQPDLLLLDEPTANLDIEWKERIAVFIAEIYKENDLTVIMVSHETGYIPEPCSGMALMKGGRILLQADRETALSQETLEKLYGRKMAGPTGLD